MADAYSDSLRVLLQHPSYKIGMRSPKGDESFLCVPNDLRDRIRDLESQLPGFTFTIEPSDQPAAATDRDEDILIHVMDGDGELRATINYPIGVRSFCEKFESMNPPFRCVVVR